jgi:hypothetical protein
MAVVIKNCKQCGISVWRTELSSVVFLELNSISVLPFFPIILYDLTIIILLLDDVPSSNACFSELHCTT